MNLVEEIKKLFQNVPPDFDKIKTLLSSRNFTKEELAEIAIGCVDNCFCEYQDACNPNLKDYCLENMRSNYILDAICLLLEFGLDPNTVVNEENVMWNVRFIDAPNIGASALRLLLENGGNPNHSIDGEYDTLLNDIDNDVVFDEIYAEGDHEFCHLVQCWLVLIAYGGCFENGTIPLTMLGDNSVEIFKNFERYDYKIEWLPQRDETYGNWIMHIFHIETKEDVALL